MSDTTGLDVGALRVVAEAATPGVWKVWGMSVMADQDGSNDVDHAVHVVHTLFRDDKGKRRTFDADHIAAFDPPTVLALLDRLEAAEAALERVHEVAVALRAYDGSLAGRFLRPTFRAIADKLEGVKTDADPG